MRTCPECGGVIGRDCFNPVECAQIGEQQRQQAEQQNEHPSQIEELEADLARHVAALKVARETLEGYASLKDGEKGTRYYAEWALQRIDKELL